MAKILNIGSLNLDYVYAVPHFVEAGETLLSSRRDVFPGGKGLNQTVAAARAGAEVFHGGAVGANGDMLLDLLKDAGADVSAVARVDVPTGHAVIQVSPQGENAIIILGGANRAVSPGTVEAALEKVEAGDILLLQNEINGLAAIIRRAWEKGLRILFNPAPMEAGVKDLPLELLDTLIVNEGEGRALAGDMDALRAAYPNQKILLTQGSRGALPARLPREGRGHHRRRGLLPGLLRRRTRRGPFLCSGPASRFRRLGPGRTEAGRGPVHPPAGGGGGLFAGKIIYSY